MIIKKINKMDNLDLEQEKKIEINHVDSILNSLHGMKSTEVIEILEECLNQVKNNLIYYKDDLNEFDDSEIKNYNYYGATNAMGV